MKAKLSKLIALLVVFFPFLISCEGSRTRRIYNAGKSAYEDYEETGDPTILIIMIVIAVILGGIRLLKNMDK